MKTYTIVVLLIVFSLSHSRAQRVDSLLYQVKIDSLQSLINHQPKEDTITVKRLNYLAQICFYDLHYQRGLLAANRAYQLAKKLHYSKGEALYWRTLAVFNYSSSLWYYYNNLAYGWYADRKQKEGTISPGVDPPNKRNEEKEKIECLTALTYFEKQAEPEILANLLVNYADFFKLDERLEYRDRAIRLFRANDLPIPPFYILGINMLNLERAGRQKEADKVQIETRTILASTKNARESAVMNYYLNRLYVALNRQGLAFEFAQKADRLLEKLGEKELRIPVLHSLSFICFNLSLLTKAASYMKQEAALREETNIENGRSLKWVYHVTAIRLLDINAVDEAKIYINKADKLPEVKNDEYTKHLDAAQHDEATSQLLMKQGNYQAALQSFDQALAHANKHPDLAWIKMYFQFYCAQCYQKLGQWQESVKYGKLSYDQASVSNSVDGRIVTTRSALLLAEVYDEAGQPSEAYKYLKAYQKLRSETEQKEAVSHLLDLEIGAVVEKEELEKNQLKQQQLLQRQQLLAIEKQGEIDRLKAQAERQSLQAKAQRAELDKKLDKERLEAQALQNQRQQNYKISLLHVDIDNQRKIRSGLLGGLFLFGLFVAVLFRQNREKQRFNKALTNQKAEIEHQRDLLTQTLRNLRTTQAQLIQKEKLASLGELTAGIAHEIQNPLNFVNNFSEVSTDLVEELNEGPLQYLPHAEQVYVAELLDDLTSNLKKINHHGQRAASIVRGMLEHSRTSDGEMQPTDLNGLAGEYLRLAYHGQRAKDNDFNCELVTHLDASISEVNLMPQEIGRVLLNLFNNAFYAVQHQQKVNATYQPIVTVTTARTPAGIEIRVSDNGIGIPESVQQKIFQPFFTTKPTGEGTGLGLSLSYDIITKGHGGGLSVSSQQGQGTEFIITLPTA